MAGSGFGKARSPGCRLGTTGGQGKEDNKGTGGGWRGGAGRRGEWEKGAKVRSGCRWAGAEGVRPGSPRREELREGVRAEVPLRVCGSQHSWTRLHAREPEPSPPSASSALSPPGGRRTLLSPHPGRSPEPGRGTAAVPESAWDEGLFVFPSLKRKFISNHSRPCSQTENYTLPLPSTHYCQKE